MADKDTGEAEEKRGRVGGRARFGKVKLSMGAISFEDVDLGVDFDLPQSPEKRVKTPLRLLDRRLALRDRAKHRGRWQLPNSSDVALDEPQRDAANEMRRFDTDLNVVISGVADKLAADIMTRKPPHYTKEEVTGFVLANWHSRQDLAKPNAHFLAKRVVETQDELAVFRERYGLLNKTPDELPSERLGVWFWGLFLAETTINAVFYRSGVADNFMTAMLLAVVFSAWIMVLGVGNGALGVFNVLKDDDRRRVEPSSLMFGWVTLTVLSMLALLSAVGFGFLRLRVAGQALAADQAGAPNFMQVEAIALTLLNLMIFAVTTFKFKGGFDSVLQKFKRIYQTYHRWELMLDRYLNARTRGYMDDVLDYYRTQFLHLKAELKKARAPVTRAVAAFDSIQTSSRALQENRRRDTLEMVTTYRERNRNARRGWRFLPMLLGIRKSPEPTYFDDPVTLPHDPLPDHAGRVRAAEKEFTEQIAQIERSVDDILLELGRMTAGIKDNFADFKRGLLQEARVAVDQSKSIR